MVFVGSFDHESTRGAVINRRKHSLVSRNRRPLLKACGLAILSLVAATAGTAGAVRTQKIAPITLKDPVAPLPTGPKIAGMMPSEKVLDGWGVSGAFRTIGSARPTDVFRENPSDFPTGNEALSRSINVFMDASPKERFDESVITPFDLSNNITIVNQSSIGDFSHTPECAPIVNGCPFPGSIKSGADVSNGFGSRFRGYLRVDSSWVGQPVHLGLYTDRAVAVTIWDKDPDKTGLNSHLVISTGQDFTVVQWRSTNTVYFSKAGLYPFEIVSAAFRNPAFVELAVFFGDFEDIEQPDRDNSMGLQALGFNLLPQTQFYQSISGDPPFVYGEPATYAKDKLLLSQQCDRQYADVPAASLKDFVCDNENLTLNPPNERRAHYCNSAGVCAACVVDSHCGINCPACRPGESCRLKPGGVRNDPHDYSCNLCQYDSDCARGNICIEGTCTPAPACCPEGTQPINTAPMGQPENIICSECNSDLDCKDAAKPVCDRLNGRCVEKIADCNTDDNCKVNGPNGVGCQSCRGVDINRPHCLNGNNCVQCRGDYDCPIKGQFCLSGQCTWCTQDAHCGPTCVRCSPSAPYCANSVAELMSSQGVNRECVRCLSDDHCGAGARCDQNTKTCVDAPSCNPACELGKQCFEGSCVECYANIHCGCGRFCDLETHTCAGGCKDTADCQGTQCCSRESNTCQPGRCAPGSAHGGYSCSCSATAVGVAHADPEAPVPWTTQSRGPLVASIAAALLWLMMRRRQSAAISGGGRR